MNVDAILTYLLQAALQTGRQLVAVFGGIFILAIGLYFVSSYLRNTCGGVWGKWYYRFVAPGVVCHETGHALGCLLTRTKIFSFKPFQIKGNTLGYVVHAQRTGFWGAWAESFIATGPVWFGCTLLILLSRCVAGANFMPTPHTDIPPNSFAYSTAVLMASVDMLTRVFTAWHGRSPWFILFVYFFFCIASEMTLSTTDLKGAWKGIVCVILLWFVLSLIPFTAQGLSALVQILTPYLFILHTFLGFAFLADMAFALIVTVPIFLWIHRR